MTKKNGNFLKFRAMMLKETNYDLPYIVEQYKLLAKGIRDVQISDAACIAWMYSGGEV